MKASHDNFSYIIVKVADDKGAYEKGVRSTISFHWNDRLHTLSIGERTGFVSRHDREPPVYDPFGGNRCASRQTRDLRGAEITVVLK